MQKNTKWFFLVALLPVVFTACAKQADAFTVTATIGDWQHIQSMDEMTDEVTTILMTTSSENDDHILGARKINGRISLAFYWGEYLAGDRSDRVRVRYRFDKNPVSEYIMCVMSSNHRMAFLPTPLLPEFFEAIKTADVLRVEVVDPSDGESLQLVFSLKRFEEAFNQFNQP